VRDIAQQVHSATLPPWQFFAVAFEPQKKIQFGDAANCGHRHRVDVFHPEPLRFEAIRNRIQWQTTVMFDADEPLFRNICNNASIAHQGGTAVVPDMNSKDVHLLEMLSAP
jgi:hypothetical protein